MRIPTAAFSFPAQRGGPDPGAPGGTHIKELRGIKQLKVQDMVVARTTRRDGLFSDDASMLERYQILRASKLRASCRPEAPNCSPRPNVMPGLDPGIHVL